MDERKTNPSTESTPEQPPVQSDGAKMLEQAFARGSGALTEVPSVVAPERSEHSVMEGLPPAKAERIAAMRRELADLQRQLTESQQRIATELQGRAEDAERFEALEARLQAQEAKANEEAARAAIVERGGEVVAAKGLVKATPQQGANAATLLATAPEPPARWTFIVRFPAARRQAALDQLGDLDRTVEIRDARETIATHVGELAADNGALVVRAPGVPERRLAAADIAAVHTIAPVVIPADTYLVVEGDRPRDHASSILIALALLTFGAFNLVALARNR